MTLPILQSYASIAVHSAREVGLESANIVERSLTFDIASTTSRVNVFGTPVAPINTCGLISLIASINPDRL